MKRLFVTLACVLALAPGAAWAQQALEILPLRHRTVDQVLPVLRPLLEPGGVLTGQAGQLIVRASPRNLAELRQALEAIDRPLRRLVVSVRFDDLRRQEREEVGASVVLGGGRSGAEVRADSRQRTLDDRVDQRVQVVEGGRASIADGVARPIPQVQVFRTPGGTVTQQTTVLHETGTGFDVVPRLAGEQVTLDIFPRTPGSYAATTVTGRLREWIEIGGAARSARRDERGLLGAQQSSTEQVRAVWVRVEPLD